MKMTKKKTQTVRKAGGRKRVINPNGGTTLVSVPFKHKDSFTSDKKFISDFAKVVTAWNDFFSKPRNARRFIKDIYIGDYYGNRYYRSGMEDGITIKYIEHLVQSTYFYDFLFDTVKGQIIQPEGEDLYDWDYFNAIQHAFICSLVSELNTDYETSIDHNAYMYNRMW